MKATLVAIGNSRGVRIPEAFLRQARLQDDLEMSVRGSQIVIRAATNPRAGWAEAFERLAAKRDQAG